MPSTAGNVQTAGMLPHGVPGPSHLSGRPSNPGQHLKQQHRSRHIKALANKVKVRHSEHTMAAALQCISTAHRAATDEKGRYQTAQRDKVQQLPASTLSCCREAVPSDMSPA